jgi:hypothetical protein
MNPIKHEHIDGENEPEGFLPPQELRIPPHFAEEEWLALTDVIFPVFPQFLF